MPNSALEIYAAHPGQRVGVFIDVQNMFYSAKHLYRAKLNYKRLLWEMAAGRQLVRAVAYMVTKPEVDQGAFVDALTRIGYETRIKYLKINSDGSAKGDWAMEMSLDIMATLPQLDTIALVTGDGDYVPLIERLKVIGIRTEVLGFPQNTATELMNSAHAFVTIPEAMLIKDKKFEEQAAARADAAASARASASARTGNDTHTDTDTDTDTGTDTDTDTGTDTNTGAEADGNRLEGGAASDAARAEDQAAGLWGD
jgi:uncharacterized LabA/DUF88 family protein